MQGEEGWGEKKREKKNCFSFFGLFVPLRILFHEKIHICVPEESHLWWGLGKGGGGLAFASLCSRRFFRLYIRNLTILRIRETAEPANL